MSKSRLAALLAASMESAADSLAIAPPVDGVAPPAIDTAEVTPLVVNDPDTAEADLVDAKDAEADVNDADAAQGRMEEIAEGLESIAREVQIASKEGGLTPQSARFLSLAVESYTKPLGLTQSPVLSCESFGGASTRERATTISLENISEKITQVWEAVKKIALKVFEAMMNFLKRIFSAAEKLRQRGEKLIEGAKAASGSPKEAQIELGSLASRIAVDGKVSSSVAAEAKKVLALFDFAPARMEAVTKGAEEGAKLGLALVTVTDATIDDVVKGIATADRMPGTFFSVVKTDTTGSKIYSTPPLPGGKSFSVTVGDGVYSESASDSEHKADESVKITVLSPSDIEEIGNVAVKISEQAKVIEELQKKVLPAMEKLQKEQVKANEGLSKESIDKALKATRQLYSYVNTGVKGASRITGYCVQSGLAFVQVGEKCLAQYTGAAAEPKKLADEGSKEGEKVAA